MEVINHILEDYLRCYVAEKQNDWVDLLPWAELHYNTATHSVQPYKQNTLRAQRSHKLAKRYYEPFEIIARIERVAYTLALPVGSRVHDVFHVSNLKHCTSRRTTDPISWPDEFIDQHPVTKPERVVGYRRIQRGPDEVAQVKVQWRAPEHHTTSWEDLDYMRRSYPQLALEDEDIFKEGRMIWRE
ncbi:hypothetical protein QQ045_024910 [Rhodiola kirilowii]